MGLSLQLPTGCIPDDSDYLDYSNGSTVSDHAVPVVHVLTSDSLKGWDLSWDGPGFLLGTRRCVPAICMVIFRTLIYPSPAAAERRELFRFSADLGKLALRIADQYGSNFEKWCASVVVGIDTIVAHRHCSRALLLFVSFISGYDNVHIRTNLARAEDGLKFGQSAGDRFGVFLN